MLALRGLGVRRCGVHAPFNGIELTCKRGRNYTLKPTETDANTGELGIVVAGTEKHDHRSPQHDAHAEAPAERNALQNVTHRELCDRV